MTNILAASLYQYQKYATLDGHVWSVHAYLINDRFFNGLTPDRAEDRAGRHAHRARHPPQDDRRPGQGRQGHPDRQGHAGDDAHAGADRRVPQAGAAAGHAFVVKEVGKDWVDRLFAAIKATK